MKLLFALWLAAAAPAAAEEAPATGKTPAQAAAETSGGSAAKAQAAAKPAEKKICKRDPASESRLSPVKRCLTAEQWRRQAD